MLNLRDGYQLLDFMMEMDLLKLEIYPVNRYLTRANRCNGLISALWMIIRLRNLYNFEIEVWFAIQQHSILRAIRIQAIFVLFHLSLAPRIQFERTIVVCVCVYSRTKMNYSRLMGKLCEKWSMYRAAGSYFPNNSIIYSMFDGLYVVMMMIMEIIATYQMMVRETNHINLAMILVKQYTQNHTTNH